MIPLAVPNLTGNERTYLNRCIDTTFVSSVGEYVNRIEEMTAQKSGSRYAVATSSGTTGLHLALTGCGVQRDEIVIIPTFTFIATANAVAHCGAHPWLMDISEESWTLNPEQLEAELKKKTVWEKKSADPQRERKKGCGHYAGIYIGKYSGYGKNQCGCKRLWLAGCSGCSGGFRSGI